MQKMNITTLRGAGSFIKDKLPFRASNLFGTKINDEYSVFSYATCIYQERGGEVTVNRLNERFSNSTSKHQAIIRNALNKEA